MTREELHTAFKVEIDKNSKSIAYGGCPAFLDEEIDYWLNQATLTVVNTKFTGNNTLQQAFEGSVKRIQDLEKLVKTDKAISATTETDTNRIIFSNLCGTSSNRMFFVNAVVHWKNANNNRKPTSTARLIDHTIANRFLETYNNKPWIDVPVATIEDNTLYIYVDTDNMLAPYTVDITYIKYPTKVENLGTDGMTEIPEYMQYEIVNKAALLALEDIESKRTQSKQTLNTINE